MSTAHAKTPDELPPRMTMTEIRARYPDCAFIIDCNYEEDTGRVAGYGKTREEAAQMAYAAGLIDRTTYNQWCHVWHFARQAAWRGDVK